MSKNKAIKTCGECRYHKNMRCHLPQKTFIIVPEKEACRHFTQKPKLTNGDKIRQMSDEELAKFFGCLRHLEVCPHAHSDYPCENCNLDWLKQEAKDE